jgi:pimeloyl-ACP methyl ester carboxylesterase
MTVMRSRSVRRLFRTAAVAALGLTAWEVQRRRDLRAVEADPEWRELNHPLDGRSSVVRASDGVRLHVETFGADDAPAIVLVHGWTCDITFWHYQIRDLSRYFRVIAYDQRGHGRSDVPTGADSYTADTLASDLQSVLDASVPDGQKCLVAGHSMGGMTIVAWAGRHPDIVKSRLAGAALINTGMNELTARLLVLGPRAGARVHNAVITPLVTASHGVSTRFEPISYRVIRRLVAGRSASPGRVAFMHRMILNCPAPVRAGFGRLFRDLDLSDSVPALVVPTIVVTSDEDRLLPPWHSKQLAQRLPDLVEIVELSGIGHMSPLEAPEAVTAHLRRLAADTLAAARSAVYAG